MNFLIFVILELGNYHFNSEELINSPKHALVCSECPIRFTESLVQGNILSEVDNVRAFWFNVIMIIRSIVY